MKVRVEIVPDQPEEVIVRCREWNDDAKRLQTALESALLSNELPLTSGDTVYFVPISEILFFETDGDAVRAHTKDAIYTAGETLSGLEQRLPRTFARASKSCLINSAKVVALSRGVTGTGDAFFGGTEKHAYVSRMYFKQLQTLIYETRIAP